MPDPVILYRPGRGDMDVGELEAASRYFRCISSRLHVQPGDLVIGRYSVSPFYKFLEPDILELGATLINTFRQHCYIADLWNWVGDLEGLTPRTWNRIEDVPDDAYPVVLKGSENSRKFQWDTSMFARDRAAALDVYYRLQEDGLLQHQNIMVRQYVPLRKFMQGFRGLPIGNEWRVFACDGEILSWGYYWSNYWDDLTVKPVIADAALELVREVLRRVGRNARFLAIDVAEMASGGWTLIELNDGQMAGTSMNDLDTLYGRLSQVVRGVSTV